MEKKKEQLKWLLDNAKDIKIMGIYPDGYTGIPTLLIELKDWSKANESDFKQLDSCVMFE